MYLKQSPRDFRVEEIPSVTLCQKGDYAIYCLEKTGWTTVDALALIRKRWRIEPRRISTGGLKDRHAHTMQHITILRGPQRRFTQQGIFLTYLGQLAHPFLSEHIAANRFTVTLRDASVAQIDAALGDVEAVRRFGVPNYFDDQRFGSVAAGGTFMAKALIQGDAEAALKIALTAPYPFDRAAAKRAKSLLRQHWGDWPGLAESLPQGHARDLMSFLNSQPGDFLGAVARLQPDLRGIYLSAYQSHLWNRMLARWLQTHLDATKLITVRLRTGIAPMYHTLTEPQQAQLAALDLPLHSARIRLDNHDPRKPFFDAVLAEEGVTQEQFKLKGPRELFFSKGERRAQCLPAGLCAEPGDDETHPGRSKLTLRFDLPRGCYATLIVKRLTFPSGKCGD